MTTTLLKITSRDPEPPSIDYVKVSGGIFLDMTVHDFDMARFIGGEVEEVYANATVMVDKAIGEAGDVDTALVALKFKSGAIGVIDNCRQACYGYDQRLEVFGSGGQASAANDPPTNVSYINENGKVTDKPLYFFLERYMQFKTMFLQKLLLTTDSRLFVSVLPQSFRLKSTDLLSSPKLKLNSL